MLSDNNLTQNLFCLPKLKILKELSSEYVMAQMSFGEDINDLMDWKEAKLHFILEKTTELTVTCTVGPSFKSLIFLSQTQLGLLPYSEAVSQGGKSHLSKLFESENKVAIPHNGLPQHPPTYSLNFLQEKINPRYFFTNI